MRKKKALSSRELETEKTLQAELPEYVIRANMRLVDVIHAGNQFEYMRGYHLDFVICDKNANTIAAIELDDSSHDTEDGKRRDANKNRWLDEAGITLIRIRKPEDALTIRKKLKLSDSFNISHESRPAFMRPKQKNQVGRYIAKIAITIIGMGTIWLIFNNLSNNLQKQLVERSKQAQQKATEQQRSLIQHTQAEESWRKQQEAEQAEARQKVTAQQPRYERMLIKGKSARECANGNVLNNETILCTKDHYETILVNGTQ